MLRKNHFKSCLTLIILVAAGIGIFPQQSHSAGDARPEFAAAVWQLVRGDVKTTDVDALGALAELVGAGKHPEEMPAAARKLARAMVTVDGERFAAELAKGIGIGSEYGGVAPKGWKFGSPGERVLLSGYLWKQAGEANRPANEVKELGKAALLLASGEGVMLGGGEIGRMIADMESGKLNVLSAADLLKLKSIVAGSKEGIAIYAKAHNAARSALYALADETFPVPLERVKAVLKAIDAARAAAPDQFARFRVVDFTWRFLNLARTKKDVAALETVTAFVADWKEKPGNAAVGRWLGEALTTDGPAPVVFHKR